jgi:hypothetical protein
VNSELEDARSLLHCRKRRLPTCSPGFTFAATRPRTKPAGRPEDSRPRNAASPNHRIDRDGIRARATDNETQRRYGYTWGKFGRRSWQAPGSA